MKKLFQPIVSYYRQTDRILWGLCLLLSCLSLILLMGILESGYASYLQIGRRTVFIQGVSVLIGILCAAIVSKFDYHTLIKLWKIHVPVTYILLLATFVAGVGAAERPDDKRWLLIPGLSTTFQPSELLKISFILIYAYHISLVYEDLNRPMTILSLLAHGAVPVYLIHMQGDDGNALMFLSIIVCMLFAAGIAWKYIAVAAAAVAVAAPLMWYFVLDGFQKLRIIALLNQTPDDTQGYYYQQHWARIALASGGNGGKGIFNVAHTYVPEMHNDFIFSFLGESFGFVGCLLTLGVIIAMWMKILISANNAIDIQGRMICMGVFAMFSFQSLINIGMNISLLPVIGNTLPFLSSGGTSVVTSYLGLGLALSVYMHSMKSMFE